MSDNKKNLTSGRHLARNVIWNLLGSGAPLLVAIVAIPILIEGMGLARFGVLTIVWMLVGYFSLFDLGLGRALTKLVAEMLGKDLDNEIPSLIWTAMLLMTSLGVLGAVVVAFISPWLVAGVLNIPMELQSETLITFYMLAASVPVVISSTGLRGVLEAHQRFGVVNAVRIPLGIVTFLGPVAVLPFSNSLIPVAAVLIFARIVIWVAFIVLCLYVEPGLRRSININRTMLMPLIRFGGWMSVSNIVSPLMVYMDRFLIGIVLSMTAVSYYATPYEVVTRLLIIPGALMGVMFPAFATALAQNGSIAALLYSRTVNYIFLSLFPVVLVIILFAYEGLNFWLGNDFAGNSYLVLQLLAIGVFLNSLANVPFGLVQSAGRADITAKLHLAELPFYLLTLWWLLNVYGIDGVAFAWLLRVLADTAILFLVANRLKPAVSRFSWRMLFLAAMALSCLTLGMVLTSLTIKWLFLFVALASFTAITWFFIFNADERKCIFNCLR